MNTLLLAQTPSLVKLSPKSPDERQLIAALVSKLRARDDAVVDRVLRELLVDVRRWMFRQLGPHSELDDAVQDALTEISRALHRFEGRSTLATLAHRITLRTSYRYYRRRPIPTSVDMSVSPVNVEAHVAARLALARLYRHLDRLPARRRSVFILCAVEGLNPAEAAEILGVSANATRSLLCRARQQLELLVADDDELGGRS